MRPLTRVRHAAARRMSSEQEWRESIRQAREQGETLRAIGEAAQVSHVRIIQLLKGK